MPIRYKLSTPNRTTHGGFKLPADGEWFYPADCKGEPAQCSNTVLHHYADPRLAVLFNPIHADYADYRLFEIEIDEEIGTDGLKGWCRAQRILRELPAPVITTEQRIAFAIYCVEPYYTDPVWQEWARKWMSGEDRSHAAAAYAAAAYAAYAAANAAAYAANAAAAYAAIDFIQIIDRVMRS